MKNRFFLDILLVAGGTATAQLIGIAFAPAITRLYGPGAYGSLSLFMSIVNVCASAGTLGYVFAIVIPRRLTTAARIFVLCLVIAVVASGFVAFLLISAREVLIEVLSLETIESTIWLIPAGVLLVVAVQVLEQWHIRGGQFRLLAIAAVMAAFVTGGLRTLCGVWVPTSVALVVFGIAGLLTQVTILQYFALRTTGSSLTVHPFSKLPGYRDLCAAARRYSEFPLFRAPQVLLNAVSRALPIALLATMFGPEAAAYYSIAQSVLYLPVSLVSQSIGKVFLQRIAAKAHSGVSLRPEVLRATAALSVVGIPIFGAIALSGHWLFEFVFGEGWGVAGSYAQWLAFWIYFHFTNVPAVQAMTLTRSQGALLVWEVVTTILKAVIFVVVGSLTSNPENTVAAYSIFGGLAYIVLIGIGIRHAGDKKRMRYA